MLQVEDLQIGDGGVPGIHGMALGDHLLREILGPAAFVVFDLREGGTERGVIGLGLGGLQEILQFSDALVGPFLIAQVTAEKIVAEGKAILDHFVANAFNRLDIGEGGGNRRARAVLAHDGEDVDHEQEQDDRQDRAESPIKFLANRHFQKPPLPCRSKRTRAPPRGGPLLLWAEREFDYFSGFFRAWLEMPFLQSIERRIDQKRAASDHSRACHVAVGRDRGLDLDLAGHVHLLG